MVHCEMKIYCMKNEKWAFKWSARLILVFVTRRRKLKVSPERFVPQVKAGHGMQTHVFLSSTGTLDAAIDGLPPLAAKTAEWAWPFGDVVFEQVDPGVTVLPQVGGGHVRHAGCLLVVLVHHVVHGGVWVCELLKRLANCGTQVSSKASTVSERARPVSHHLWKGFQRGFQTGSGEYDPWKGDRWSRRAALWFARAQTPPETLERHKYLAGEEQLRSVDWPTKVSPQTIQK